MDKIKIFENIGVCSTEELSKMAEQADKPYALICTGSVRPQITEEQLARWVQVADDCGAPLSYADHWIANEDGTIRLRPCTDYQPGSLRDDFYFGPLLLVRTDMLRRAVAQMSTIYKFAGIYDLRLRLSRMGAVWHINEPLYLVPLPDAQEKGERQFDYVDPHNRESQLEMEHAATAHLKAIDAWLAPIWEQADYGTRWPVEASVVIPVRMPVVHRSILVFFSGGIFRVR